MATIRLFKVPMSPEAPEAAQAVLKSGCLTEGAQVKRFEGRLAEYLGNPRVAAVNSATSGLHLALHLLKFDALAVRDWPGMTEGQDEVLSCPLTCAATNWPVLANRLKLKWVDADPDTCMMDLADLERKLSPTTKVVMIVHWGGATIDYERLDAVLDAAAPRLGFRPMIIEDCAHAFGATHKGVKAGHCSRAHNICVFSFQAIKHLTTGDGGAIAFPCYGLYHKAKLLRWYGIDRDLRHANGFRMEHDIVDW